MGERCIRSVRLLAGLHKQKMHIKQLMIPLVAEKEIQIPPDKTTPITLFPKCVTTSYPQTVDFQGKTMIVMNPFDN